MGVSGFGTVGMPDLYVFPVAPMGRRERYAACLGCENFGSEGRKNIYALMAAFIVLPAVGPKMSFAHGVVSYFELLTIQLDGIYEKRFFALVVKRDDE